MFPCQTTSRTKKGLKILKKPCKYKRNDTGVDCDVFRVFLSEPCGGVCKEIEVEIVNIICF